MRHEQTWATLQEVVNSHGYTDGSRFQLERDDDSNYCLLYVFLIAPNSYRGEPGNRPDRYTRHEFVVPCATYSSAVWQRWIYERLCSAAIHEVGEWFQEIDPLACRHCGAHDEPNGDHTCSCLARDGECGHTEPWRVRVYPPYHGNGEDPYVDWTGGSAERAAKAPGDA